MIVSRRDVLAGATALGLAGNAGAAARTPGRFEATWESQNAVSGQCQKTNRQFGCYAKIVNGKSTGTICVD